MEIGYTESMKQVSLDDIIMFILNTSFIQRQMEVFQTQSKFEEAWAVLEQAFYDLLQDGLDGGAIITHVECTYKDGIPVDLSFRYPVLLNRFRAHFVRLYLEGTKLKPFKVARLTMVRALSLEMAHTTAKYDFEMRTILYMDGEHD